MADPPRNELDALSAMLSTAMAFVTQMEKLLVDITAQKDQPELTTSPPVPTGNTEIDAEPSVPESLSIARDAASLIRAHSTKLSLLIVNEPFTPTAITTVLRETIHVAVPGLVSAAQTCDSTRYTETVRRDLLQRCTHVLRHLKALLEMVPTNGEILPRERREGHLGNRGSMATTGVLWASCDELVRFAKLGVAGRLVEKVEDLRATLNDVYDELKLWGEEVEDSEEEVDDPDLGEDLGLTSPPVDNNHDSALEEMTNGLATTYITPPTAVTPEQAAQAAIDALMDSPRPIPKDDPDNIRTRLDSCLKRLRLTTLLYHAIIKRRIRTLPTLPTTSASDIPSRIDEVIPVLRKIPERFGELTAAFYELNTVEIDKQMDGCLHDAFTASQLMYKTWDDGLDTYSTWALKFQEQIQAAS